MNLNKNAMCILSKLSLLLFLCMGLGLSLPAQKSDNPLLIPDTIGLPIKIAGKFI